MSGRSHTQRGAVANASNPGPTAPTNTSAPVINQAVVGQPSTCTTGGWSGTTPITYAYQWKVAGTNVGTGTTYTPVDGDATKALTCVVTATNSKGSASHTSNSITVSASGTYIPVANAAALMVVMNAGTGSSGNKSYRLAATDFGSLNFSNFDYSSAPLVLSGQLTAGQTTAIKAFFDGSSGITLENVTFTDTTPNEATVTINNTNPAFVPILTFNNNPSNSGLAMGSHVGTGYLIQNVTVGLITINGSSDATKPDIYGRGSGVVLSTVGTNGGVVVMNGLTMDNMGTDAIIGAGAQNITINAVLIQNQFSDPDGHPDAMQFFSDASGNRSSHINITNCGIDQGQSGTGQQGIFLEGCTNFDISDTWVRLGIFNNSIAMAGCDTMTVDNSFIQGINDPSGGGAVFYRGASTNGTITNNEAVLIAVIEGSSATQSGNTTIANASSTADYTAQETWAASHPTARVHA